MIKAGLMLEIDSWENDGDYNRTKQLSGLTDSEVLFLVDLLDLFKSRGGRFSNGGLSEEPRRFGDPSIEHFNAALNTIITKHADQFMEYFELGRKVYSQARIVEIVHEKVCQQLLGYTEEYTDVPFFFRACDDVRLYNVPCSIFEVNLQKFVDGHTETV